MPWNEDGSRKNSALYKKSRGFKMKGWSAFTKEGEGKRKWKKFFGKDYYTDVAHSELGENTDFTVGKRRTVAKGPKGKIVYKGSDKEEIDANLAATKGSSVFTKDRKQKGPQQPDGTYLEYDEGGNLIMPKRKRIRTYKPKTK